MNNELKQCIKEWDEKGWSCRKIEKNEWNREKLRFYEREHDTFITIYLDTLSYIKEEYYADGGGPTITKPITLKEHELIHKTIKALKLEAKDE